jgi:hypothetical protein
VAIGLLHKPDTRKFSRFFYALWCRRRRPNVLAMFFYEKNAKNAELREGKKEALKNKENKGRI